MIKTILGTKLNMSSVFNQAGHQIPVTSIVAEPNVVVGMRDHKIILGFGKKKKAKKTENAFVKAAGYSPRYTREVTIQKSTPEEKQISVTPQEISQKEIETDTKVNLGDKVTVSIFEPGDEVKVTGTTKGKGFAGGVKRWGFAGGPKTHGQSDRHRAPGSIGAGTTPGRVFKGKKMAGHMGNSRLTVTGLEVIEVNPSKNFLLIKGAIPGPKNGFLIIEKTGKAKKPATTATTEVKHEVTESTKDETAKVTETKSEDAEKRTESDSKQTVETVVARKSANAESEMMIQSPKEDEKEGDNQNAKS